MAFDGADGATLEGIKTDECWELVRSRSIGRFAFNRSRACPLVMPVNYVVEADSSIVFRSGAGSKLTAASAGLVAIQVDEVDPLHRIGWSVLVEGTAVWHPAEHDDFDGEIDTWAPGVLPYLIRVAPMRISGRRIRLLLPETDGRGYL